MQTYVAYYKFPVWMWLAAPFTVGSGVFFVYALTQPSMYDDIASEMSTSAVGLLLTFVPIPVLIVVFAAFTILMVVLFAAAILAAVSHRESFRIDAQGVSGRSVFGGDAKMLKWHELTHVSKTDHAITFRGTDAFGRKVRVNLPLMGQKKKDVQSAILNHRPDLKGLV